MNTLQMHYLSSILQGKREITEVEAITRALNLKLSNLKAPFLVAEVAPYYAGIKADIKDSLIHDCADFVGRSMKRAGFITYYIVNEYDNVQVIITQVTDAVESLAEKVFMEIRNKLQLHFELDSFIGIGSIVFRIIDISTSAHDAAEMLSYKYTYAEQGVVNVKNLIRFSHSPNYSSNIRFDRVIGCFQDGNIGRMAQRLNELIIEIRNRPNVSDNAIKRTFIELAVSVLHVAANADVNTDRIIQGVDIYQWILEQQHTEILTEWFIKLCEELHEGMQKHVETTEKSIVQFACQFIDEHIDQQELGLAAISEAAGLSTYYFSKLFKKEKGIGLSNYISVTRIDLAKRLLSTTELTLTDIARQSGFTSAPYFCQVFKKTIGITPGEYRRTTRI